MGEPSHPSWRLQAHLSTVWGDHAIAGANAVKLVDASAGTWAPRPGCAAPQVLFYVVGHFRTFAWTQHHLAAVAAQSVVAADLDGDGWLDLASATYIDNTIAWYRNLDGQGSFSERQVVTSAASAAYGVAAADLDGDGCIRRF